MWKQPHVNQLISTFVTISSRSKHFVSYFMEHLLKWMVYRLQ